MKRWAKFALAVGTMAVWAWAQQRAGRGPAFTAKPEELAAIGDKAAQIDKLVAQAKAKHADPELVGDVEVYAKAGRFLVEFPELMNNQNAIDHAMTVLDTGMTRAQELLDGKASWNTGKKQIHAYYSAMDGSVQPYSIDLPENYDPSKPARLYVWLHGRQNNTTESEFLFSQATFRAGNPPVADVGQIQVNLFGRINGQGWHFAGEDDIFEGIRAVEQRFKIDQKRIILRGFSQGGEGAWHIALHHPDSFVAAEIGAGTWSRRASMPGLEPYQYKVLNIWENMEQWALNGYNLPFAGHDGDKDTQPNAIPTYPAGTPNRGQLESSLHAKAQLEKEGFKPEGDPDYIHFVGIPDIFLISQDTGHGTSPLVRQRLDAFLKEWGDKGQVSPDHIRFVTYTARYNRDYWVTVDQLGQTYERADVDAVRSDGGAQYTIQTHNVDRLVLRETEHAKSIKIDGTTLKVQAASDIAVGKINGTWTMDPARKVALTSAIHKTHGLQGPIDDAFLDPYLLVRPTGTPWNEAVNQQALRTLAHFDKQWGKFFRGHPYVKDDKDVTINDMAKYHMVLFGDPGSNKVMAKLIGRLPIQWTKDTLTVAGKSYPANENFPAMIYPNPQAYGKYVVLNTGMTISDGEYNGDYAMPRWGDFAVVKVKDGADTPDLVTAGLFDEKWQFEK